MDKLRVFVLGETHVGGIKIVKGFIYAGNFQLILLKGPAKGPTRRTQGWSRHCLGSVNDGPNDGQLVNQLPVGEVLLF